MKMLCLSCHFLFCLLIMAWQEHSDAFYFRHYMRESKRVVYVCGKIKLRACFVFVKKNEKNNNFCCCCFIPFHLLFPFSLLRMHKLVQHFHPSVHMNITKKAKQHSIYVLVCINFPFRIFFSFFHYFLWIDK